MMFKMLKKFSKFINKLKMHNKIINKFKLSLRIKLQMKKLQQNIYKNINSKLCFNILDL